MKTAEQVSMELPTMSIGQIASEVRRDWKKVNFGAVPYLDAMDGLDNVNQQYGSDSGRSIVNYFLNNASTWRGPIAKLVKTELRKRVK